MLVPEPVNLRVLHRDSLAKYAANFFWQIALLLDLGKLPPSATQLHFELRRCTLMLA